MCSYFRKKLVGYFILQNLNFNFLIFDLQARMQEKKLQNYILMKFCNKYKNLPSKILYKCM